MQAIRKSLASVANSLSRIAAAVNASAPGAGSRQPRGRKLKLSAGRRAALKLQGQYMGHLRNLKPGQKARAKMLRVTKGMRAAIAFARSVAKR